MRTVHRTTLVVALAASAALGGCGGSGLSTPPPVAAPSGAVATGVDPTPVGGVTEGPGVVVTAQNLEFQPQVVTVPANVPLTLVLDNRDQGIPHDIQVSDANGNVIVKSEIITGPQRLQIALPALAPGVYPFMCVVHPNMTGTITAQ